MICLTARQEDNAADEIARRGRSLGIKKIFGVSRGGIPLAIKISYRMDELPVVYQRRQITNDTLVVEDIIHSGKTIQRFLRWLKKRGVRPKVACWVERCGAPYKSDIVIRTVNAGEPVQFPSETRKSALASFRRSEKGR